MVNIEDFKRHYKWSIKDEENMDRLRVLMEEHADDFIDKFYTFIHTAFEDADHYLKNEEIRTRHKEKVKKWFLTLFIGIHDDVYFRGLFKIGLTHLHIGLPPHYVNSTITFIRDYINGVISESFDDRAMRDAVRATTSKILDLNLDIISSSFREEELRPFMASGKFQKHIIDKVGQFSFVLDIFLMVALVAIATILGVFMVFEIYEIVVSGENVPKSIVEVLGGLLILWSISELLSEGTRHLRGGRFAITAFISVGLAASIREVLIGSLGHDFISVGVLTVTILVMGIVYYLLSKIERQHWEQEVKAKTE